SVAPGAVDVVVAASGSMCVTRPITSRVQVANRYRARARVWSRPWPDTCVSVRRAIRSAPERLPAAHCLVGRFGGGGTVTDGRADADRARVQRALPRTEGMERVRPDGDPVELAGA